ncbi:MAG TPA: hypothetical protein VGN28_16770 [Blastococcus sp.]|jgi:hypothetical protein|nr:hypothetical protein [Blastococcus sp.]
MSLSHHRRRLALATLTLVVWLTVSAAVAAAKVGPDTPEGAVPTPTRTVLVTTVDWAQLALTAAVACLVGVLATLAIQLVVHHSHRHSMAHA